jgi:hypothetical protein
MVRKQIYIHKRHQIMLKRLAQARGLSEAEIVRRAIEREATGGATQSLAPDRSAWEEVLNFIATRQTLGSDGTPYRWDRQDAYQERENRYNRPAA